MNQVAFKKSYYYDKKPWKKTAMGQSSSTSGSAPAPPDREELLLALGYVASLQDDWDGNKSLGPTAEAVSIAKQFIMMLPLNKIQASRIRPDGDGGITFIWDGQNKEKLIMTVDSLNYHLSAGPIDNTATYMPDIPAFDEDFLRIPEAIQAQIPNRVYSKR